ncbi:MAG: 6-phosphofructokinase [Phycisphaerae bacterium]|nr:6-phosphofructokinase [Phycisphaerae bacterium]
MAIMKGRCVVAQSGGPTAVINASACGVIQTALARGEVFTGVYGAYNGILGVLEEDLFDLGQETPQAIEGLKRTPAAALGSCRYKLKDLSKDRVDYERILEVFKAHDIRYFFYIGGNDSMDTADKVSRLARELKYDLVAIGVPKTIDNDLAETDHCPGYGSVAKYVATAVMEAGRDTESLYTADTCNVIEVMGRNAGWIAAATGIARRTEEDAPHLIYLPEIPFSADRFVADVRECLKQLGRCVVAVGEGIRDAEGRFVSEMGGSFSQDSFGHKQLGGVAEALQRIVEKEVGVKCRTNKLGLCQRTAMHFASLTDRDEAYRCGQAAVEAALAGERCKMVTLVRQGSEPYNYCCGMGLADLATVANGEKVLPREYMNEAGNHITTAMRDYAVPLMRGEVKIEIGPDGLPLYVRLRRQMVERCTPLRSH